ncbi:MAG: acyl-CoA reductase [Bacteroidia bacterium]|nr:acyl-CoA reductase [Bacteroidia bacterium]
MTLKQRIDAFTKVGLFINRHFSGEYVGSEAVLHEGLNKVIDAAGIYNNWFIPKYVNEAIFNIGTMLGEEDLTAFAQPFAKSTDNKIIALVCAGNIPMVCFHDVLCVLLSGNTVLLKLSSDDNVLMPFFLKLLCHYEPEFETKIVFADGKLGKFDAIIATGSDNTASHLHYYFGKYPNIIRKSRTSVAVIKGDETSEELKALGKDVFTYFGLGCRNVGKLLVPQGYNFNLFFESIVDFGDVVNNKKYGNNYDYHRAIYLLESMTFLDNNFLLIRENQDLYSPVGTLYFQYYQTEHDVSDYIATNADHLQCVIGRNHVPFGYSQHPVITDFADNVNTVDFLVNL